MSLLGFFCYIATAFAVVMALLIAVVDGSSVETTHARMRLHPFSDYVVGTTAASQPARTAHVHTALIAKAKAAAKAKAEAAAKAEASAKADASAKAAADAKAEARKRQQARRLAAARRLEALMHARAERAYSPTLGYAEQTGGPASGSFSGRLYDRYDRSTAQW